MLPPQRSSKYAVPDPVPDPEPATPSLPGPDFGVFHHEPGDAVSESEPPQQSPDSRESNP